MKKLLTALLFLPLFVNLTAQNIGKPEVLISIDDKFLQSPKYSPDGNYISFTEENYNGIFLLNISSGEIKEITNEPAAGFGSSWSGNSKLILARTAKFENNKRTDALKLFDIETKQAELICDYKSHLTSIPQWDEHNSSVSFVQKNELFRTAVKSLKKTAGLNSTPEIKLLLDGTRLVYINSDNQLVNIDPVKGSQYLNLVLSPDKSKAAFEVYGGNLFAMNIDGSELVDLGKGEKPAWSPDGKYIAYTITDDNGQQYTSSEIYKVGFDGVSKIQLTSTPDIIEINPCWSPDGTNIVFNDAKSGIIFSLKLSN
jgi:Tol biopolymer transport system component